mmetsp:Transcript_27255/g.61160  ORF Transcript_27255/g.61160 Transcript_27255/m.61160 type:complete len:223 (-) Transcript_27255:323-991(-)
MSGTARLSTRSPQLMKQELPVTLGHVIGPVPLPTEPDVPRGRFESWAPSLPAPPKSRTERLGGGSDVSLGCPAALVISEMTDWRASEGRAVLSGDRTGSSTSPADGLRFRSGDNRIANSSSSESATSSTFKSSVAFCTDSRPVQLSDFRGSSRRFPKTKGTRPVQLSLSLQKLVSTVVSSNIGRKRNCSEVRASPESAVLATFSSRMRRRASLRCCRRNLLG